MKTQSYTIMAKIEVECDTTIEATSLADAVEKAEKLERADFMEMKGEVMEDTLHIKGLFEN